VTPVGAAGRGLVAGLVATAVLSLLARVLPGMENQPGPPRARLGPPRRPDDPFDAEQVRRWQRRAQAPAAHEADGGAGSWPGISPAAALTAPQAPGPEGLAEQFAFKAAAGLFETDISPHLRPAGIATHVLYGSAWGLLYGLLQATYHQSPVVFGALYGLLVWLVGPVLLVPAMGLTRPPPEQPPARWAPLLAGHLAYGLAAAAAFEALERRTA
jgi:hypothetical protein